MTCPSCNSTRTTGVGELATCARCGRFVTSDNGLPACPVAERLRAEMTPEQRAAEQAIRRVCWPLPRLLSESDL